MTEDEARKKWCPMVRAVVGSGMNQAIDDEVVINSGSPVYNVVHNGKSGGDGKYNTVVSKCIASDCMMWQLESGTETTNDGLKVVIDHNGDINAFIGEKSYMCRKAGGKCGLT